MDDLLREFLAETTENLDTVDLELVRFEQDPHNAEILNTIFRVVHTLKGTCGFLGLPRLAVLAHAAETLMDRYREGLAVSTEGVELILTTIDRIKSILAGLEASEGEEPAGSDADLIAMLEALASGTAAPAKPAPAVPAPEETPSDIVSLEELDRVFRETRADPAEVLPLAPIPTTDLVPALDEHGRWSARTDRSPRARSASASTRSST